MTLYDNIRKRREQLNITQQELAERMGYTSRSTISKIENGENDIPQSKIIAFAKALNTTPAYLMGWEDETTNKSRPSGDERVDEILAKNEVLREFYDILKTLPEEQQTELLETAIFLAEKKAQQQRK